MYASPTKNREVDIWFVPTVKASSGSSHTNLEKFKVTDDTEGKVQAVLDTDAMQTEEGAMYKFTVFGSSVLYPGFPNEQRVFNIKGVENIFFKYTEQFIEAVIFWQGTNHGSYYIEDKEKIYYIHNYKPRAISFQEASNKSFALEEGFKLHKTAYNRHGVVGIAINDESGEWAFYWASPDAGQAMLIDEAKISRTEGLLDAKTDFVHFMHFKYNGGNTQFLINNEEAAELPLKDDVKPFYMA